MSIIISDVEPRVQYTATAGQTSFTVGFEFFDNADLKVFNGTSLLTFSASPTNATQYSVSGAGQTGGGSITLGSPGATVNDVITISRDLAIARSTDFPTSGAFQIASLNTELDKIIAMAQQLERDQKLSPRVATTSSSSFNLTFPDMVAGKVLSANSGGTGLEFTVDASGLLTAETNAATSATNAGNSATAAAGSATSAENAKNAAEAALDTFDDDFLGSKSSDPSVDNDGATLADGALYFNTSDNVMKVYDLGNTQWKQLVPTTSQQTNIDAAVSNATNINNVAGQISPTNNISTVAGLSSSISTLASMSGLSTLAGSATAVTTVANNLTAVNNFADVYRIASSAPTSSLNAGDLYFDTTADELKVYKSGGWAAAGSTVNGTSNRFEYTATANQTTFTGADSNSKTLAYDAGFIDVYLNGVKLANSDYTATSGSSVVLASGAAVNDILMIVAYGTFQLANISINDLTDTPASIGSAGQALVVNSSANALVYSNASSAEVYGFEQYYNPSTLVRTVTVASVGGSNKYFIDGVQQDTLDLYEGNTYIFNYPSGHPFKFSTTSDGTHGSGSEYTTGVTHNSSTQVTIVVASGAPTLYYYCASHSAMGGQANTPTPGSNAVRYITTNQGVDNITESQYANFDDVLFSASGFVFSINSNGNLIATI
tara:strand:- start:2333 stop:4318 length:1986 start_codon:yes stop_codon:yes gene_type:complete